MNCRLFRVHVLWSKSKAGITLPINNVTLDIGMQALRVGGCIALYKIYIGVTFAHKGTNSSAYINALQEYVRLLFIESKNRQ